jgi:protease PrsW
MLGIDTSNILLECIDGKDDHTVIEIPSGQTVVVSGTEVDGNRQIKELLGHDGYIALAYNQGKLVIDATSSPVPVKVNGLEVTTSTVNLNDLLRIGNSIWRPGHLGSAVPVAAEVTNKSIHQHFGGILGIEGLKDFKLKHIFSSVFKKHTVAEMEEQLVTGTSKNIPALTDIEPNWARPWLFSRFLLVCIIISALLVIGFRIWPNPNLVPGLIFVGAFAMPLATLIFYLEMNTPRNISIFMVMLLVFVGGVLSLLVTMLIADKFRFINETFDAAGAAIVEEPAKLLIVLMMAKYVRYKWILNGLLFGAAVGTGFGAFESAGYALNQIVDPLLDGARIYNFAGAVDSIVVRGVLAPFMHVLWTANVGAALWMVKGDKKFSWGMLKDTRFLRVLLSSVVLHFIWNSKFGILKIPLFGDLKFLILGFIGWTICFMLVQSGLRQLNKARQEEIDRLRSL